MEQNRFAYLQIDSTLAVTAVSPNWAHFFPTLVAPVGQPLTALLAEFIGAEAILHSILLGERESYRLEDIRRNGEGGESYYFTYHVTCLNQSDGQHSCLLLTIENITEEGRLKQALVQERNELRLTKEQLTATNERLQQLDEFKNMFLSMAAHDLRTPLFVISGYLQMLLIESLATDSRELVANALLQIQWLDHLVLDFLSLDKIERGELVIEPQSFDLNRLIRMVEQLFVDVVASKEQQLLLELPAGETAVWGEEGRIRQVLFNLLSNATKYSLTQSSIRVSVRQENGQVVLQVADTGPGLTAEELELIFVPYYRSGSARQANISGTGLGLFITKMLVEAHNGTIVVASELNQGTKFTIHLPSPPDVQVG